LGDFFLWAVFEDYESSQNFGPLFPHSSDFILIPTKNGLGYILGFWAIFSQTHLVTLE
jgi:hypothetical protein